MDAAAFVANEVLLHKRPIEPGPSQVHHSICAKVTLFNVELLENQLLKSDFLRKSRIGRHSRKSILLLFRQNRDYLSDK